MTKGFPKDMNTIINYDAKKKNLIITLNTLMKNKNMKYARLRSKYNFILIKHENINMKRKERLWWKIILQTNVE
jgi:hypothetical protein